MGKKFVFDLDNTLYPPSAGLWEIIDGRIEQYVSIALNVDRDTARNVRKGFLKIHGTTLKGLMLNHSVDPGDYLAFVHNVDIERMIQKDGELLAMFNSLPYQKYVFTNASHDYALRVLASLGIEQCFEEVLDIQFMDYLAKPGVYPFRKLISYLGVAPGSIVFFDDVEENIITAKKLGIISILISPNGNKAGADVVIDSVKKIPSILDDIVKGEVDLYDK